MPNSCRSGLSAEHTKKGELCLANIAPIFIKKLQTFLLQQAQRQQAADFALCTGQPRDPGMCPPMFAPKMSEIDEARAKRGCASVLV